MRPKRYLPFIPNRWQLKLGLRSLSLQDWIEIDDQFADYLQQKEQLLRHRHSQVFASLPGSEAAQQEVLDLLLDFLPVRFPGYYQQQGSHIQLLHTQQTWDTQAFAANPLDLAGRLVQEDLCLLQPDPNGYRLVAGSVCFPSFWQVQDKIGKPLALIHQPVPAYDSKLSCPVDNFFSRLTVDSPGYRLSWGLARTPALFPYPTASNAEPLPPTSAQLTPDTIRQNLWLRVERQTLRRLPASQHILFTIRTYIYPLAILETHPNEAQSLLSILQDMPEATQHYKNIYAVRDALMEYLERLQVTPNHL